MVSSIARKIFGIVAMMGSSVACLSVPAVDDSGMLSDDEVYDESAAAMELNFHLEDLLNLPNDESDGSPPRGGGGLEEEEVKKEEKSPSAHETLAASHYSSQEACYGGLCIPSDELAYQLEWLSAFNEDSSYSGDRNLAFMVSSQKQSPREHQHACSPVSVLDEPDNHNEYISFSCFPSRARSKRSRCWARVWSLDTLVPTLLENKFRGAHAEESLFNTEEQKSSSRLICVEPPPPEKRVKKDKLITKNGIDASAPRRCSHCLVQKTPQWRAGPMGPKTLCNACGVRYKSGRLLPEYRPAGSPTFLSDVHSNSHKKVLEMRKLKEMQATASSQKQEKQEQDPSKLSKDGKLFPMNSTAFDHVKHDPIDISKEGELSSEYANCRPRQEDVVCYGNQDSNVFSQKPQLPLVHLDGSQDQENVNLCTKQVPISPSKSSEDTSEFSGSNQDPIGISKENMVSSANQQDAEEQEQVDCHGKEGLFALSEEGELQSKKPDEFCGGRGTIEFGKEFSRGPYEDSSLDSWEGSRSAFQNS